MALLDPLLPYLKTIRIDDKPLTGQQSSRNQTITAVQAAPRVWRFDMEVVTAPISYNENRAFIQQLRQVNTQESFTFNLQAAPVNLKNLIAYQGTGNAAQIANITVASRQSGDSPASVRFTGCPINQALLFRTGDLLQVGPAVRTVVQDYGTDATGNLLVTLSDALVTYPATGNNISVGANITWTNCYFTDEGYPTIGATAEYGARNSVMFSTGGSLSFVQTRT